VLLLSINYNLFCITCSCLLALCTAGTQAGRFRDHHSQYSVMASSLVYVELWIYGTCLAGPLNFNVMRFDCIPILRSSMNSSHLLTRISLLKMSTCTRNCHPQGVMLPKLLKALLNLNSPTFCKCTCTYV